MGEEKRLTPQDQARRVYEAGEKRTAEAMEGLVAREGFGELLARVTENTMAVTKMGFDAMDLVVRNLRLAGRRDVARLGGQLARTEDKLERVLQEVEELRDEVAKRDSASNGSSQRRRSSAKSSSNGRKASSAKRGSSKGSRSGSK
jgi:hypothetical protein